MIEGFVAMVVGVTVVFAFLGLLVLVMQASGLFFKRLANRVPEKSESKVDDLTEIAVAVAAVKAHVRRGT